MAKTAGVQLSIDTTEAQQHWNAAQQAIGDLKDLGGKARDAFDTLQISAATGTPGTLTFSVNATTLITRLSELKARMVVATGEVDQVIALLQAGLPVTVTQIN